MKKRLSFGCARACTLILGLWGGGARAQEVPAQVPDRIEISPQCPAVTAGKTVQFKARVFDTKGKRMAAKVFWNVTDKTVGTINHQNGLFRAGLKGGTFRGLVTARVSVPRVATVTGSTCVTIDSPYTGGTYTGWFSGDNYGHVAISASKTSFEALFLNLDDDTIGNFSGRIDKDGNLYARNEIEDGVTLEVKGKATGWDMEGSWKSTWEYDGETYHDYGSWSATKAAMKGAGPHFGSWAAEVVYYDDYGNPNRLDLKGQLGAVAYEDGTWANLLTFSYDNEDYGFWSDYGTWDRTTHTIDIPYMTYMGVTLRGDGRYDPKSFHASGNLYDEEGSKVGNWSTEPIR